MKSPEFLRKQTEWVHFHRSWLGWCIFLVGASISAITALVASPAAATLLFAIASSIFLFSRQDSLAKIGVFGVSAEYREKLNKEIDRVRALTRSLSRVLDADLVNHSAGIYGSWDSAVDTYESLHSLLAVEGEADPMAVLFPSFFNQFVYRAYAAIAMDRVVDSLSGALKDACKQSENGLPTCNGEHVFLSPEGEPNLSVTFFGSRFISPPQESFSSLDEYRRHMEKIIDDLESNIVSTRIKAAMKREIFDLVELLRVAFDSGDLRQVEKIIQMTRRDGG
ncbi:hypothetical protein PIGHUM_02918 [Pigmentiphaga humi]|uniref:5-bromo-4-chloroindolyl phosphate hydrolysis protein n=1 Tax=Pigmentiphaga humi TaxID=2478468 RepID=A0A3P4B3H4_9BURK|nr:hypothetical protein [Pigmentiphaga humi]VCU70839.1 hypothetical protein PIGHUM_02918 [Pigmentiphaga humi]